MTLSRISPEEAALRMREGYVYLDVRNPDEFALGHPRGAYNIPWLDPEAPTRTPNSRFLEVLKASFAPDQPIVVGCQTGRRSLSAAELLIQEGYAQVVDQRAGFAGSKDAFGGVVEPGWQARGLPIAYQAEPGRDYRALQGVLAGGGAEGKKPGPG
jgi:rhodanese-related sulfurtransferase